MGIKEKREKEKREKNKKLLDRAIKTNPKNAEDYFYRGNSKAELGDHQGAIEDYTKAIEINPRFAEAYNNRGNSKEELGNYQGAIEDYTKAIEIDPNDPDAYSNRGVSKGKLGDHQDAIKDHTKAIEIDPKFADAYTNRGNSKDELGNHQGAIKDHTKAIDINPKHAGAYNNRGNSKHKLGDYQGSIDDCTKAIEINPKNTGAYSNRGLSKYKLEDYEDSIKDCDKAIEIAPNEARVYYNRGNSKAELKDHQGAIDDFFKLTEHTKRNPKKEKGKERALYQYMPIDSKKLLSLINREVYFADYQILNDPFECYFMQNNSISKSLKTDKITARILSLTHNPKSHIMYSHYANSHTGICVEYGINFEDLKEQKKVSYGPVQYQTKNEIKDLTDLYMLKHKEWKYEDEYRIVRFDGEEFMDCEKIKSITFALDCSEDHKKIIHALMSKWSSIKYYQITVEKDSNNIYRNEIEEQTEGVSESDLSKLMLKSKIPHQALKH